MQEQTNVDLHRAWEAQDYTRVRLLAEHLPQEVERDDWLNRIEIAQIENAVANSDAFTLRQIRGGQNIAKTEEEALLLARAAVHERDSTIYDQLDDAWQADRTQEAAWVFLEADALIVAGENLEAKELLQQHQFDGRHESNRLLRLSILSTSDPREVMRLVDESVSAAADNPDALAFRGQILESLGELDGAHADYVRSVLLSPESPLFWDQLGEFYRRHQQYVFAIDSWIDAYEKTGVAEFWIKAWFWQRVTGFGNTLPDAPNTGPFAEYAHYLESIPKDRWWNTEAYDGLPYASKILEQRQETYWLRLLQMLADDDDGQALQLLRGDPFADRSWAPRLKQALRLILLFRWEQAVTADQGLSPRDDDHQFYHLLVTLNGEEISSSIDRVLDGSSAWAAAFLAEGWISTAIQFDEIEAGQPAWFDYGQAQARRQLVSAEAAVERLNSSTDDPSIRLLKGELLWLNDQADAAVELWEALLAEEGAIGDRAGMLIAIHYASKSEWERLQQLVDRHPSWSETLRGKEILARMALSRDEVDTASALYESILGESTEAKVFFANQAFQAQNWAKARALTETLINEHPNEPTFYRNLQAINQAEATQ
ncbi:MAG: hypothetical protein AAFX93_01410 [Verrucomicrobiota bacterium]